MRQRKVDITWWQKFFGADYLLSYQSLYDNKERTKKEVDFFIDVLKLKKTHSVLDLCCGAGRHTLELARRGYKVTGFDFSRELLAEATRKSAEEKLDIEFIQGDARYFDFHRKYNFIINIFTSFGYSSEEDDLRIIKNVSKSLKKGGYFLIDVINFTWLIKNFKKEIYRQEKGVRIYEKNYLDVKRLVQYTVHEASFNKRKKVYNFCFRIYTYPELEKMLNRYKLLIKREYGSFSKDAFEMDSPFMIIVAKKI